MIVFGFILQLIGFILCLTVIGAVIGIPLIVIGGIMVVFGFFGRRKTVITNVVQVQNSPAPAPAAQPQLAPVNKAKPAIIPPEAAAELPSPVSSQVQEEPVEPRSP